PEQYQDYITTFIAEKTNQLMHGFHYALDWPGGSPDMEYVNARSVWSKLLALELGVNSRNGYDSPALVVRAIEAGSVSDAQLCKAWFAWKTQREKPEPPQKVTWVSDFMVTLVHKWLIQQGPGSIAWCAYDAFGVRFTQLKTGYPYYGAGSDRPTAPQALAS